MSERPDQATTDAADYSKAVGFMSQHLVALCCDYENVERDGSTKRQLPAVFSGWLIELHGQCFWVTAGHCLKETLDDNLKAGHIRLLPGGGFMDYLGYQAKHFHHYPFTYERGCGVYVSDFTMGMDFALIPVDDLMRQAFEVNKNKPISRINWLHQPSLSFDFYRMLGIPGDRVFERNRPNGTVGLDVQPAMLAIDRLDYAQASSLVPLIKSDAWFFGQIHPSITPQALKTIKGMSGGPIFGFRRDAEGGLRYHVVALQSWWDEDERIIIGCSVPLFAEAVYHAMQWDPESDQDLHPTSDSAEVIEDCS